MARGIYTSTTAESLLSSGSRSNPLAAIFNGRTGQSRDTLLYLRSDSDILAYTSIVIKPVLLTGGKDLIAGSAGYSWKLSKGATQPTVAEWNEIVASNSISMDDLSDSTTYSAFWLRRVVPTNAETQSATHASLQIVATET